MNPNRLIPENLGGTDILLDDVPGVGAVEFNDALYAFGPGIVTLLGAEQIIPSQFSNLSFILTLIVFALGLFTLILKPDYMTLTGWIKTIREYRGMDQNMFFNLSKNEDGELVNSERDTREEVGIERIYPSENVIETTDGRLVGLVKIKGLNLYNAPKAEVDRDIASYTSFLNTQVNDDFQLYLPMRKFDPTPKINHLEERLEDTSVGEDEFLRNYAEDRILWLQMTAKQSFTRDYYAVLETSTGEVVSEQLSDSKVIQILENLGGPGKDLANIWAGTTATRSLTRGEKLEKQLDDQEKKLEEFRDGFERSLGTNAEIVDGNELGVILKEFWEGIDIKENQKEDYVRKNKYIMSNKDKEVANEQYEQWKKQNREEKDVYGDRV